MQLLHRYQDLYQRILDDYQLSQDGIHGVSHWMRVIQYGLEMAEETGADKNLIVLFGLLHDSRRDDDGSDFEHGPRAARYLKTLQREALLNLTTKDMGILSDACAGHTSGFGPCYTPCVTIQTCWDADKLDLHRFGYEIDTRLLWTDVAIQRVMESRLIPVAYAKDDID